MKDNTSINPSQKVFVNLSLILLGICANGAFFSVMVTLLLGTVAFGYLRNQQQRFVLTQPQTTTETEKLPITR